MDLCLLNGEKYYFEIENNTTQGRGFSTLLQSLNPKSANNLTKRIYPRAGDYSVKPKTKYCIRPSMSRWGTVNLTIYEGNRQAILGRFRIKGILVEVKITPNE